MKAHRIRFPPRIYRNILVKQDWKCACCGGRLEQGDFHFDHILGLELGGKDEPENLQVLLRGHHQRKTDREASARAKTVRIQKQDGLRRKKESQRDKVMAKALGLVQEG